MVLEYRTNEWDLIDATHVCRYWRSALISSPRLWTCFSFKFNPDFDRTLTYLGRSKSVPIDVSLNIDLSRSPEVLSYLSPRIAETRSLILQGIHGAHVSSSLSCNPAPSLQHLELYSREGSDRLPDDFLGRQAPSLRFVSFNGICPTFESPFPLPNLTEFSLYLPGGAGSVRMNALFRFFSDSPLLQKICVSVYSQTTHDVSVERIVTLESLAELDYDCNLGSQVLSFLKLPRLQKLRVTSSPGPTEVQKLADILPYDGRALLAGATGMVYCSDDSILRIDLVGNGIDVSIGTFHTSEHPTTVDWFSDQACIPFGQIEDLKIGAFPIAAAFPIDVFALENLRVLRITLWDVQAIDGFLQLFHPDPILGVPCRCLQEIECTYWGLLGPLSRPLISLARERREAGYKLELISLPVVQEFDRHLVEELREHVGEVRLEG